MLYFEMISQTQNHLKGKYIIQQQATQKVKHWVNSNSILVLWNDYVRWNKFEV